MRDLLGGDGVCLVEWAEKIAELLPTDCIQVTFTISGDERREIAVDAPDLPRFDDFRARSQRFQPGG
jgi:tRNA A37 threonylcarbamoyladenosine biosynthesis protein TsaE